MPELTTRLTLTRQVGEEVIIGPLADGRLITVRVCDIRGAQIRLGVSAPRDISVLRKEVRDRLRGAVDAHPTEPV